MNAVDTNVLIYMFDPRDAVKQAVAKQLVDTLSDGVLLWQVACEFLAAGRKLSAFGYSLEQGFRDVHRFQDNWHFFTPSEAMIARAADLHARYKLSFWDSLIAAACLEAGVTCLYTEDFGGSSHIDGLLIVNPFTSSSPT